MKRSLTTALLTILLALPSAADTIRKGFTVAEGGTLTVRGGFGNIRVVSGGTGVAVEIVRTPETGSSSRAEEALRRHTVEFGQNGNDVTIESRWERDEIRWLGWSTPLRVQYNIRVPDRYNVVLSTSGGRIEVDDLEGRADVKTSGGDIKLGRVAGEVNAHTSGGDLAIAYAGAKLVAKTSGGSIEIEDSNGPVEARTSGGSIDVGTTRWPAFLRTSGGSIEVRAAGAALDASTSGGSIRARLVSAPQNDTSLSTSGGDVVVEFPANGNADLDAHASGGSIESDLPVMVIGKQSERSLTGKLNAGGPRLSLRTSGGAIRLKKG